MPLVKATRKPVEVSAWPITDAKDMADALMALQSVDYYGVISSEKNVSGEVVWTLSASGGTQVGGGVRAHIGDALIWDGTNLGAIPQATFDAEYIKKS